MAGNKKKTQEAEQRAMMAENQARAAQAEADSVRQQAVQTAKEKIELTPEAQGVLTNAGKTYAQLRSGQDVSGIYGISNFLRNTSRAMDTARRSSAGGAASLAEYTANPEILAMNEQKLKSESANNIAAGVDTLAKQQERESVGDIMNVSGMKAGIDSNLVNFMMQGAQGALNSAGLSGTMADTAWDRYKMEKQQRSPFWNLAGAAIGAAGNVLSAGATSYFGKKG